MGKVKIGKITNIALRVFGKKHGVKLKIPKHPYHQPIDFNESRKTK